MNKMTVKDLNVTGKRVLVRVDFNVPLSKELKIDDESRIMGALPLSSILLTAARRSYSAPISAVPRASSFPK